MTTTVSSTGSRREDVLAFHQPWIDEHEIREVTDTLGAGSMASGRRTRQFEQEFARFVEAKHAVAVGSFPAALHLALKAANVRPGDEVITAAYAAPSLPAVILHLGARPVLVDVDPDTLTIDPARLQEKISPRTRAIVPIHLAGRPCPMDEILEVASQHELPVIDDATDALPARYGGRVVGSIGDLAVFNFESTHPLTTADGAIITTDRDHLVESVRANQRPSVDQGIGRNRRSEISRGVDCPGYKYAMGDLNAAIGVQQLRKLDMFHAIRSYHANLYTLGLSDLSELALPPGPPRCDTQHAWSMYVVRLQLDRLAVDRDVFARLLLQEGIMTCVPPAPLHILPQYRAALRHRPGDFPVAFQTFGRIICLPIYPRMTEGDVWDVISAVRQIVERTRVPMAAVGGHRPR